MDSDLHSNTLPTEQMDVKPPELKHCGNVPAPTMEDHVFPRRRMNTAAPKPRKRIMTPMLVFKNGCDGRRRLWRFAGAVDGATVIAESSLPSQFCPAYYFPLRSRD